jgi:hypothetical protein
MKTTRIPISFHTSRVESIGIFYREVGDPQAPAALLLNGFPASRRMLCGLISELVENTGWSRLIRGFGVSDAQEHEVVSCTFDHPPEIIA